MPSVWLRGYRLTVFLPINTTHERVAAQQVIAFLHHQHGGSTHSPYESPLVGYWHDPERDELYRDEVLLAFTDIPADQNQAKVEELAEELRHHCQATYEELGSEQLAVWVTIEQLSLPG